MLAEYGLAQTRRGRCFAFGATSKIDIPKKVDSTISTPPYLTSTISTTMDGLQLRDEAVRDRVRAAQEFLDPRTFAPLPPELIDSC